LFADNLSNSFRRNTTNTERLIAKSLQLITRN
jgi:hypothetical protein